MLQIASRQRRNFRIIHFNTSVTRVDDFQAGKVDQSVLLNTMEHFTGGGTSFEAPLTSALEAIKTDKCLKKADVVFITDGECDVSDEFLANWTKARKTHQFTMYGVDIQAGYGYHSDSVLSQLSTKVVSLQDFVEDGNVADAVFTI